MRDFGLMLAFGVTLLGALAIGAYLVMHDHPWFALLVFFLGGSMSYSSKKS